jgi:threonine synthase
MMTHQVSCTSCGLPYPENGTPYICECGSVYDFSIFPIFSRRSIDQDSTGIWQFRSSLGLAEFAPVVTLGEGRTPLLPGVFNGHPVFFKMESQNPTGSYKDRGSAVLVSFLLSRGVTSAVEDSSGNAGASLAAYCARAGLSVRVYIPESASGPKRWQIEMYGAHVERIPGARSKAAEAVLRVVKTGSVYASHAYMPFGLTGIATIAYEIFKSLGRVPGTIITPVGHGGLLYGIMLGFEALQHAGFIKDLPFYIGVQAENCAPVVEAYQRNSQEILDVQIQPTLAEGASVARPLRAGQILRRMQTGAGKMLGVSEDDLHKAYLLSARQGLFCEPTSCLSLAPLLNDKIEVVEPVVVVLTGSGSKTNTIST